MKTTSPETFSGVIAEPGDGKCLDPFSCVIVERPFDSIFKVADHNFLNNAMYCFVPVFKIVFLS